MLATVVVFRPSYDTNDDVFMTMIAAGKGFCPAPDEHLIFTNILVGHGLKVLYTVWPGIPWYGLYLLCVHYLAQVALIYLVISTDFALAERQADTTSTDALPDNQPTNRSLLVRLGLYVLYFGVVELLFLNNLQFTSTAFVAAQAGVLLTWFALQRRMLRPEAPMWWPLTAATLLWVVAALIRLESLVMALVVALPLASLLARHATRRALVPCGTAAVCAALLILAATVYDRQSYDRDPHWSQFFSYNALRVKFNDYRWTSYTPQTADAFSAVGWSKNDHEMIANWFFDDPQLYSEANLSSVLLARNWKTTRLTPGYFWQSCKGLPRDRAVWAVLLVLPLFIAALDPCGRGRLTVMACALAGLLLLAVLTLNTKVIPPRVYFPLVSFPLAVAMLWPGTPFGRRDQRGDLEPFYFWRSLTPQARLIAVLMVVGVIMGVYRQARRSVHVHRDRLGTEQLLADLESPGKRLCVCWEAAMPFELISPLDSLANWSVPLVNLVWTQRTPWQEKIKQDFGIANLAQALIDRDDVVLVATEKHRSLFATFAKEHFGADVQFLPCARAGAQLVAGHFRTCPVIDSAAVKQRAAASR